MRRAAKTDANQAEIVADLRAWRCAECGKQERWTAHRARNTYCSRECARAARKRSGARTALHEAQYNERHALSVEVAALRTQKMTMTEISGIIRVSKPRLSKICAEFGIDTSRTEDRSCEMCGDTFRAPWSSKKRFCSPSCFKASGGYNRAGEAAVMAKRKYGAKKDANHNEVFDYMRARTAVHDLSNAGFGVPDGLAWVQGGWHLFDVKNPETAYGRRGLNDIQKKWADDWRGGPVFLVYGIDDADALVSGRFDELKKFPESTEQALSIIGVEVNE